MKITQVKTLERLDRIVVINGEPNFVACTHPATVDDLPAYDLYDIEYGNAYFGESIVGLGELSDELTAIDPDWYVIPVEISVV